MRWWIPNPEEPELMAWWRPLLEVAAVARDEQVASPIYIDEFILEGKVLRSTGDLWAYRHRQSGGLLFTDGYGYTFRFIPNRPGALPGRFEICSPADAIAIAGLEEVVEPVWYGEDAEAELAPYDWDQAQLDLAPVEDVHNTSPKPRPRGHLRLLPSA
jgi:hypothetical protein